MVDDHNSRRHSSITIEEVWATKTWEHRVFAFFLAITEVNLFLVTRYYYNEETTGQLDLRKKLAKALINNKYIIKESEEGIRRSKRHNSSDHELLSLPKKMKFSGTRMIKSNMEYAQFKCTGCKKRIQTYCRCSPGTIRCQECYALHIRSVEIVFDSPVPNSVAWSLRSNSTRS